MSSRSRDETDPNSNSNSLPRLTIPDVSNIDISKLSPAYGGNKSSEPDYIIKNARGRDFGGRIVFIPGVFWLSGFFGGGSYGLVEGWKGAANPNLKIRMNSVMNAVSRRGGQLGNSLGVVAFLHTCFVWAADQLEVDRRTGSAIATPAFAGFMTGTLFKSAAGPRGALLSGAIGTGVSCVYWFGGSYLYNIVLRRGGRY